MIQVADYLSREAKKSGQTDPDAFARTAFNRYYYAAFLSIREFLNTIDPAWIKSGHKNIPDVLTITLMKKIKKSADIQLRNNLINDRSKQKIIHQANTSTSDIANILKSAYEVRVVADYYPEKRVSFTRDNFILEKHSQREAENWKSKIDYNKGILLHIVKELAIVQ
jgi:hypothetical protein